MKSIQKTATIRNYKMVSQKGSFAKIEIKDTKIEFSEFIIEDGLKGVRTEDGTEYYFSDKPFTDNELIEINICQKDQTT